MIVKVRVGNKYEYLEIPEFLKEDYYNDIERHLTEGEVPISGRVLRWGRSKRVVLHTSENCKFYSHRPNILGGIAECVKEIKPLNTFWANDACDKFEYTEEDKLEEQKDFYKTHLGDTLNVRKD